MWLEILILGHLRRRPAHGYEIKQRVGSSTGHIPALNNNVLYPALHRLEEMGAVESELVPQEASPPRRVYRLTDRGLESLRGMLEDFPAGDALDEGEFNIRVAYFDLVEPETRVRVLNTRATMVERLLDHLRASLAETAGDPDHRYVPALLKFLIRQRENELRFLRKLAERIHREEERQ